MLQNDLRPPRGAKHKRKRVGRGNASGHGTYSTRGLKGQKARSGPGLHLGFEGGQLPLIQRLSRKRGFTNIFRVEYEEVNLSSLAGRFPTGSDVTPEALVRARVIKNLKKPIKVLAQGDLGGALTVHAHKFSAAAREKIEAAGGKADVIGAAGAKAEATEAVAAKAEVKKAARRKAKVVEPAEGTAEVTEAAGAKAGMKKIARRKAEVVGPAEGTAEVIEAAGAKAEVVEPPEHTPEVREAAGGKPKARKAARRKAEVIEPGEGTAEVIEA